jgi:type II secretory pathway pseudopilin PulG
VVGQRRRSAGFSLFEMLVALGVFMVVGGAAFTLVQRHVPLFSDQQNQANLNFALRNAAAQMQIDVVNAGTGFYPGTDIAAWPIGVTIKNNYTNGTSCYDAATHTYGSNCFDELRIIATDTSVPPSHPTDNGSNCVSTTSSTLFLIPVTGTLSDLAADFKNGDQVLLVSSNGLKMTTTVLTQDGQVSGGKVKLQHNPTGAGGINPADYDPLGISVAPNNKLGEQFCDDDWVLKLSAIRYAVDASDASNPKLVRIANNSQDLIAEQIIGFKVGALVKDSVTDSDVRYKADAAPPLGYNSDWTSIRAVRVTLIGRTGAITNINGEPYRNSFDQGPYRVEAVSVAINPRNLSMND